MVTEQVCIVCGRSYPPGDIQTCGVCGPQGILDVRHDYDAITPILTLEALGRRSADHWRYRELLPLDPGATLPPLRVGWTPIYDAPRLAEAIGVRSPRCWGIWRARIATKSSALR